MILFFLISLSSCNPTGKNSIILEVNNTGYVIKDIPVHAEINLPTEFQNFEPEDIRVTLESDDGEYGEIPGQITDTGDGNQILSWILPETSREKPVQWKACLNKNEESTVTGFSWKETPGKYMDLLYGDRKIMRYNYELDEQFKKDETLTANNKVFYHIYDLQGENLITNGPEEGVWSHHRGIMIGWRDVGFRDSKLSFWGMEDLTVQKHIRFVELSAGPVLAKVEALIHWNDSAGYPIIEEKRSATVYYQSPPAIMLLDYSSSLKAINGPVELNGNAEHGGVQYRAHNDVAEEAAGSKKPVYYFHKDDIDPYKDYNLPWVGMTYGLNNKTYSVIDMDHSGNPKPSIWSAYRDYGRFGPFFEYNLVDKETLTINYRFWISESLMPSRKVIDSNYKAYENPPLARIAD